jgi:hypothetical protein
MRTLSLSSCEAYYIVAKEVAKEAVWIWHVLAKCGLVDNAPIELRCDNQSVIHLACNLVYHSKTKHIGLDTHYIQYLVAYGVIGLEYCPIEHQVVDIFTKSMTEAKFIHLRNLLGM